jgi:hypothetical protein
MHAIWNHRSDAEIQELSVVKDGLRASGFCQILASLQQAPRGEPPQNRAQREHHLRGVEQALAQIIAFANGPANLAFVEKHVEGMKTEFTDWFLRGHPTVHGRPAFTVSEGGANPPFLFMGMNNYLQQTSVRTTQIAQQIDSLIEGVTRHRGQVASRWDGYLDLAQQMAERAIQDMRGVRQQ